MTVHVVVVCMHLFTSYLQLVKCVFWLIKITGANCTAGDLSMNSKCYRKVDGSLKWYSASSDCLSRGGSLAVFNDIGRPSDNRQLTDWLDASDTYWIGLIKPYWKITDEGDDLFSYS